MEEVGQKDKTPQTPGNVCFVYDVYVRAPLYNSKNMGGYSRSQTLFFKWNRSLYPNSTQSNQRKEKISEMESREIPKTPPSLGDRFFRQ